MAKETDLEYVARQLNDRKGLWRKIAGQTDLSYSTVRFIALGKNINPTSKTINRLAEFLRGKAK